MAQEVASAYVTLLPSARGFGKNVEKELGGGFEAAEKKGSSAFGGLFKKVGAWAAGAAVAVGGYFSAKKIFGGGLDRLLNIEDAQAKLRGLGHDADSVASIMNDALASVKGTAYGLDTAATVAASAVAAGIEPGRELERYLRLTADAATIAGTSMDEMGSIINQVTSKGYAGMENMNRLTERGIPIMQWLADEYGVTQDALSKMVSAGEVDAETFRKVIEDNIGGAALASGETTRGALANMGAALSRVGANLMGGVFPLFKEAFSGITTLLGPVEDGAKRVGDAFGAWATGTAIPAVQGVVSLLRGEFTPAVRDALGWEEDSAAAGVFLAIGDAARAVGPTLAAVGGVLADVFAKLGPSVLAGLAPVGEAFGTLLQSVGPLIPQLLAVWSAMNPVSLIFQALLPVLPQLAALIGGVLGAALGAIGPVIAALVPVLSEVAGLLIGALAQAFTAVMPAVQMLLPVITSLVGIVGGVLLTVIQALTPLLLMIADVFAQLIPVVLQLVAPLLGIVVALMPLVAVVGQLIGALLPPLVALFMALLGPILQVVTVLVGALAPILTMVAQIISAVLVPIISTLIGWFSKIIAAILPVVSTILGGLVGAISSLISWLSNAAAGVAAFVTFAVGRFNQFTSSVREKIDVATAIVRNLPNIIRNVFSNAGSWLADAGRRIIQGLIDGIQGAFNRVRDTLSGLTDLLPDWKGPAERDAKLLFGSGRLIIGSLVDGLESEYGTVRSSLAALTGQIAGTQVPAMDVTGNGSLAAGSGSLRLDGLRLHPADIRAIGDVILAGAARVSAGAVAASQRAEDLAGPRGGF